MRDRRRQCVFADTLMVMGGLVGVSHGLEHAGVFTVYRLGLDDLIAGYPLAGLLIVFGLIKLPRRF